jgi:hypothetical protein
VDGAAECAGIGEGLTGMMRLEVVPDNLDLVDLRGGLGNRSTRASARAPECLASDLADVDRPAASTGTICFRARSGLRP